MDTTLNLTSVFGTDFAGVILLLVILLTKGWSLPARKKESRIILMMIVVSIFNCVCNSFVSFLDGRAGMGFRVLLFVGNTYLYLYNLFVGISIIYLVVKHIDKTIPRMQIVFFVVVSGVELTLLICNFFKPLVFSLDENNVYSRGPYYMVFLVAGFVLILYGYTYYFVSKIKNPALRYFPVWQFLSPIVLAVVVQAIIYGVSLLPVGFAIAFVSLVICLQNECIYIDKLTGVYNRYELDKFRKIFPKLQNEKIGALMLDLNGFKEINDNYSHEEGDAALVAFADILVKVIRNDGLVMRFAGDEFIVIVRKCQDEGIGKYKERIKAAVDEYNKTSGKPYPLSVSIGGDVFSYSPEEPDFIEKIDQLMYSDKEEYYKEHLKKRGVPAKETDQ